MPVGPPPGPARGDLENEVEIPYRAEVVRKSIHLLALVVPLFMWVAGREVALAVLVPLALLSISADVLRARSAWFARLIYGTFGSLMRGSEIPPVGGPVRSNGATWVLVAAALLALLFPLRIAVPAFVMFMISDAAAALVGRRFGCHHWGRGSRTVEGSAAFLATGVIVLAFFPDVPFWTGAASVAVACAAEALPGPLNDNLRVPLVAALVIFLLERMV